MNEHAGPSCALSVLIVGVFAVLLHDRQPSPTPSSLSANPKVVSKVLPTEAIDRPKPEVPVPAPSKPITLAKEEPNAGVQNERKSPPPPTPRPVVAPPRKDPEGSRIVGVPKVAEPHSPDECAPEPVVAPRLSPALPKAPFTVVQAGEKLVDVANRVYGTASAAESLWRANRDQVALMDSTLAKGTLLRTP